MSTPLIIPVRILLIGSGQSELRVAADMARAEGAEVAIAGDLDGALASLRTHGSDLVLIDVNFDVARFIGQLTAERIAVPVLACGIDAPASLAVAAIRAGARDYLPLPPQADLIAAAIMSVTNHSLQMVGDHPAYRQAVDFGLAMARSDVPVLVTGESGCGKEMMARAIHGASGRTGRFVTVDAAVAVTDLVEAELFGQEEGAFEGAVARRAGRVEEAADGTLYLKNVDKLDARLQTRLTILLAEGKFTRLGGGEKVVSTARIIAGTVSGLPKLAEEGLFRPDLVARLAVVKVAIPPLRQRVSDIRLLANHFAARFSYLNGVPVRWVNDGALHVLADHDWPGNVRDLEHVLLRAVLLARTAEIGHEVLTLSDGRRLVDVRRGDERVEIVAGPLVGRTVADVERELILNTLKQCRGNRTSASSILGISVRTMRNKIRSFVEAGIPVQ